MDQSKVYSIYFPFLLITGYILYAGFAAIHLPVSFDEAKYYLVIREISDGRVPWRDIHPGPPGFIFYQIHGLWLRIFGVGYEIARSLNILITAIAITMTCYLINKTTNESILPIAWLMLYALNPFIVFLSVGVSHFALSNAFMIIGVVLAALLLIPEKHDYSNYIRLLFALMSGIFLMAMAIIRLHLIPLLILIAILCLVVVYKRKREFLAFLMLFSSIVVVMLSSELLSTLFVELENRIKIVEQVIINTNPIESIIKPEIFQPLIKQIMGFSIGSVFIFIFLLAAYALLRIKSASNQERILLLFCVAGFILTFLPSFFARYLVAPSFSYFFQSMYFMTILSAIGITLVGRRNFSGPGNSGNIVLLGTLGIIVMQNLLFIRPDYWLQNPTYSIFKQMGSVENDYAESLYNSRAAAGVINRETSTDDIILLGQYSMSPYLEASHVIGMEMNIHRDYFKKENWSYLVTRENDPVNEMGITANQVMDMLRNKEIAMIVNNSNRLHKDLFSELKGKYCFYREVFFYQLYKPCVTLL